MADIAKVIEVLVSGGAGAGLLGLGRWLGRRLDQPAVVLQVENERLRRDLERLGAKYDNLMARALAVAVQVRQNPDVDDALVEDMPTGVRNMADLIAKKPPSLPPETKEELREYLEKTPTDPNPIIPAHRQKGRG